MGSKLLVPIVNFAEQVSAKGQTKLKWCFQVDISSKKRMKEFYFTTGGPG